MVQSAEYECYYALLYMRASLLLNHSLIINMQRNGLRGVATCIQLIAWIKLVLRDTGIDTTCAEYCEHVFRADDRHIILHQLIKCNARAETPLLICFRNVIYHTRICWPTLVPHKLDCHCALYARFYAFAQIFTIHTGGIPKATKILFVVNNWCDRSCTTALNCLGRRYGYSAVKYILLIRLGISEW